MHCYPSWQFQYHYFQFNQWWWCWWYLMFIKVMMVFMRGWWCRWWCLLHMLKVVKLILEMAPLLCPVPSQNIIIINISTIIWGLWRKLSQSAVETRITCEIFICLLSQVLPVVSGVRASLILLWAVLPLSVIVYLVLNSILSHFDLSHSHYHPLHHPHCLYPYIHPRRQVCLKPTRRRLWSRWPMNITARQKHLKSSFEDWKYTVEKSQIWISQRISNTSNLTNGLPESDMRV